MIFKFKLHQVVIDTGDEHRNSYTVIGLPNEYVLAKESVPAYVYVSKNGLRHAISQNEMESGRFIASPA